MSALTSSAGPHGGGASGGGGGALETVNLYTEHRLYRSAAAREAWDNYATLFSLVVSLEHVERAYVRGTLPDAQYAPACSKLLAQCRTLLNLVTADPAKSGIAGVPAAEAPPRVDDVAAFMALFKLDTHAAAAHRLAVGVPATVEHARGGSGADGSGGGPGGAAERAKNVAELTQAWITLMDALKLKLRAKDQLHPLLSELMSIYAKAGGPGAAAGGEDDGRARLLQWLISLNQMKASDELSEEQARQMLYEVESAYSNWFRTLQG